MIDLLFLAKVLVSLSMVTGLTFLAEHRSPRVAGVLSGYPLGIAIALFFVGIENGPEFAAQSAIYTAVGLSASLALVAAYRWIGQRVVRHRVSTTAILSVPVFILTAAIVRGLSFGLWVGVAFTVCVILVSWWWFRNDQNVTIDRRVPLNLIVLLVRAVAAASIIVVVTGLAGTIGEEWTGVLSAFPMTLFPLLVIIHHTYGWPQARTIIKNFPLGMGSLLVYALSVAITYPRYGVALGTFLSFCFATLYLMVFFWISIGLLPKIGRANLPAASRSKSM